MSDKIDAYVNRLDEDLARLPDAERERIVAEIRSHLVDRAAAGGLDEAIAALGPADRLARGFLNELPVQAAIVRGAPLLGLAQRAAGAALVGVIATLLFLFAGVMWMMAYVDLMFPEMIGGLWVIPAALALPATIAIGAAACVAGEFVLRRGAVVFVDGPPGSTPRRVRAWREGMRKSVIAVLALFAAWGLNTGSTMGWMGGDSAIDDTRYISPVGLAHVLEPHSVVSPYKACRWFPSLGGETELCRRADDGEAEMAALWLVRPALAGGALFAALAAILCLARLRRRRDPVLLAASGVAAALAATGVALFMTNIESALAVFGRIRDAGYGGIAYQLTALAILLLLVATGVALADRRVRAG